MNPILITKHVCTKSTRDRLVVIAALSATAALAFVSSSCATSKGFGQDVQKVGEKIETEAVKTGGAN